MDVILFGQAQGNSPDVVGWWAAIVQTGATGILGYFLLFTLPRMHKDISDTQLRMMAMFQEQAKLDREGFERRSTPIVNTLEKISVALPNGMARTLEEMVLELRGQSAQIERQTIQTEKQTEQIGKQTEILEEWPSDPSRICLAMKALEDAGLRATVDEVKTVLAGIQKLRKNQAEKTK